MGNKQIKTINKSLNSNEKNKENEANDNFEFFTDMPDDLIIWIFQFIDHSRLLDCAVCCSRFYDLALDPMLWKETSISVGKNINQNTIISLAKKIPHLRGIRIKKCSIQNTIEFFQAIKKNLPNINNIELNSITDQQDRDVAKYMSELDKLISVSIIGNKISIFADEFSMIPQLESLNLLSNNLNAFPTKVFPLLRILKLDINHFVQIPEQIDQIFPNIEHLFMNYNSIVSIPDSIQNLSKLRTLEIRSNKISGLPLSFANLSDLRVFNAGSNPFREFPKILCSLRQLQVISLNNCGLREIPPEISELRELLTLNLANNYLKEFPIELCSLGKLSLLDLRINKIDSIPLEIRNMTSLQELIIFGNSLISLPFSISELHLYRLLLQGNSILNLPDEFGNPPLGDTLIELDIRENPIQVLNPSFLKFRKLVRLLIKKGIEVPKEIVENLTTFKTD
ncbi:hypothetical protein M0811_03966 [Anaeramoeba ignava]|uniref:F-box domain-containing protein n=1 Tax=Anaeramoeba ignava TaxID=1746090 RepID=A0A9Q0LVH9_ANAIG|nr:hypothetical protein M0811_03966 [Anaeramoeba ignava]